MSKAQPNLIAEFVAKSQTRLADVANQMRAIERQGDLANPDQVNAAFRTVHAIQGAAGLLKLDDIGRAVLNVENLLGGIRRRELTPTSEVMSRVLASTDAILELLASVNSADSETPSPNKVPNAGALPPANPPSASPTKSDKDAPAAPKWDVPPDVIREAMREFLVECHENLDLMDQAILVLEKDLTADEPLRTVFRVMHTVKGSSGVLGLKPFESVAHTAESLLAEVRGGKRPFTPKLADALLKAGDALRKGLVLLERQGSLDGFNPEQAKAGLLALENNVASPVESAETPVATEPITHHDELSIADSSIRVDVALLDKLMTRIGELVLTRNQILQQIADSNDPTFVKAAQRLNLITSELQEDVMKTRMQPIGTVWNKLPRVVRDLSAQLGKQVRIEMDGQETELDKTIVEAIKDPLTHIIRNSVDHGIERPDARRKAGKPAEGRLFLHAFHEGGQVNIEITDDGAGLKLDRIRAKALECGAVTAEELSRLSDRETALLIFSPGFSTAEKVTNVSGRGVGMDIVKTNIEQIGGEIELVNQPGQGLTVKIKIPLTLAIIPALIVMSDGDRYAIPQVSLIELLRIDVETAQQKIEFVGGAPVYRLRGKLLPLVFLSERLGVTAGLRADERIAKGAVNIVVLQANDRQFGLIVDRAYDTEEIVVKPLSRQLQHLSEYAGATIMGDGTVSLILDVLGLAATSGLATQESTKSLNTADEQRANRKITSVLLVDLGDARRYALPASAVSRLEKVNPQSIERADGHEVIQYRGSILPLVRLTDVFGNSRPDTATTDDLTVVVYTDRETACGLVVGRIVDIVETGLTLQNQEQADDNLLGTAVIHERVTDIVNVPHLASSRSHRADRNPTNRCGGPA